MIKFLFFNVMFGKCILKLNVALILKNKVQSIFNVEKIREISMSVMVKTGRAVYLFCFWPASHFFKIFCRTMRCYFVGKP